MERLNLSALNEHIASVPLLDHHVHGCWLQSGDRKRLENGLNEANTEPLADFDSAFDTQLGFAVRAYCGPLLGLPRHAYWDRRPNTQKPTWRGCFCPHVGFGDRDCDLNSGNPLLLLNFLRRSGDTPIMLLHCYPL